MVDRTIYWKKHFVALFITIILFVIGLLIGLKVSDTRLITLQEFNEQQKADFESLQLQYAYLTTSNGSCVVFKKALDQSVDNLETARIKLESYMQASTNPENFISQKRSYMLAEIRYWLLTRETRKACGKDSVDVLFFYQDDENCQKCSTQGYILTSLKDTFKDKLLIFSLDASSEEPMVSIIKNVYNVTSTPSVVVDGQVIDHFTEEGELHNAICTKFNHAPDVCNE